MPDPRRRPCRAIVRSCRSSGCNASSTRTTVSANRIVRNASPTESCSILPSTRGRRRMPGGVDQADRPFPPGPVNGDCIAGDPGFGTGQQALFADQTVDEGRFADVWTTNDRELQRLYRRIRRHPFRPRTLRGERRQPLVELGQPLAVLGRNRYRIAEAKPISFADAGKCRAAFGLVGDQNDRLAAAPQPIARNAGRLR